MDGQNRIRTSDLPARTLYRANFAGPDRRLAWEAPSVEEVGKLFAEYEVLEFLGRGGMGAVYKARQSRLNRFVAIKLLPSEISHDPDLQCRFAKEALALAKLSHPSIIAVHDAGTTIDGLRFIVMEYVDGETFHDLIQRGCVSVDITLGILTDVCEGLQHAHERHILHRDIKPTNILINRQGRAKLADFGVARISEPDILSESATTGATFGTYAYMAPEQMRRGPIDHRVDIYAVGVMLQEALSKQIPQNDGATLTRNWLPDRRVGRIMTRAMQVEPNQRYQNVESMLLDLRMLTGSRSHSVRLCLYKFRALLKPASTLGRRIYLLSLLVVFLATIYLAVAASRPTQTPLEAKPPGTLADPFPWHNWISEARDEGSLPELLDDTPDGIVFKPAEGRKDIQLVLGRDMKNQAVRVTYFASQRVVPAEPVSSLQLIVRSSPEGREFYAASAYSREWVLQRRSGVGRPEALVNIPKTYETESRAPRTAELRVVGTELSFWLNGRQVAQHQEITSSHGHPRVHCSPRIVFKKIEWRELE